jgi:Uma2 family endonuclease
MYSMEGYDRGEKLAWLIDPKNKRAAIYRQGKAIKEIAAPATLSGEDVLPCFVLDIQPIWQ